MSQFQKHKSLNIYISRSLLTDISVIEGLTRHIKFIYPNSNVYYYQERKIYDDRLVRQADLIISVPYRDEGLSYNVGKGQCGEIALAMSLGIPIRKLGHEMKCSHIFYTSQLNEGDWKMNYAVVRCDSVKVRLADLVSMLFGPVYSNDDELLLICKI